MWYAILDSKEVPKGKPIGVTRFGKKLVLWRSDDQAVHCIVDRCCHRGAALHKGQIKHNTVECPFHGFRYDELGRVKLIPANGKQTPVPERFKVNAYPVKEAYGLIWCYFTEAASVRPDDPSLPEVPFFEDLKTGFAYSGFAEVWPVHYTRAIENQLDVVHLPFVHATTIGRGQATLVNGPVVKWENDLMTFYVLNETDQGQKPLKPNEVPESRLDFHLQLQMPNTWQNILGDSARIFAAFVPVDEHHTKIYLRFYHNFLRGPIGRSLMAVGTNISNRIILHQDRRVVLTQEPDYTQLQMDEMLIQGDLPIIEYRKRRHALQHQKDPE